VSLNLRDGFIVESPDIDTSRNETQYVVLRLGIMDGFAIPPIDVNLPENQAVRGIDNPNSAASRIFVSKSDLFIT
jgi:hypothetical protein